MEKKRRILFLLDHCLTPYERIESCGILCEKDTIIAIGGETAFSQDEPGLQVVKLENAYGLPGFIDTHIHGLGANSVPVFGEGQDPLHEMSRILARHGVTTFFPTIVSLPRETMIAQVDAMCGSIQGGYQYAEPQALHLEGPFINPQKRGDQLAANISPVDLGFARELFEAGRGRIKVMTFAPEMPNAVKLVELMLEHGVIPSMGHSLATESETLDAIDAGAHRCTYIFNAMPAIYHRSSSLTAIALTDDRVTIEIIVDGLHLHPTIVNMIVRCKPADKIVVISNAVVLEHNRETGAQGVVRLGDGVISGSTMTLDNSWLHLLSYGNLDESLAAACVSTNPAKDLGLITRGELRPGKRADITILDSKTNRVRMTVSRGNIIYDAENPDL
ncbi:MAG: amidohydrolase family protein [Lentisphaeria bacterium]|nr:amidohydrolase family protein [Lentisphaeria bacterium]